jgi:D-beta-D-heptose 7-phosphate kinase/D-beta-D-heptose 1-phosphate adenosyltransferase
MKLPILPPERLEELNAGCARARVLVVGDVMLDRYVWGHVGRISPEAPVPVVEFERESAMPGGAANVARNVHTLGAATELLGYTGKDEAGDKLRALLREQDIRCTGLLASTARTTSVKTRIIAHQQQIVRVDRETRGPVDERDTGRLLQTIEKNLSSADAVIVCDYGKGVVTQPLLDGVRQLCRARGVWLSLDPKPVHELSLTGLSLLTPNRKEAFELAGVSDGTRNADPLKDVNLMRVADTLLMELSPALLLITLGDQGMLLCQRGEKPFHIPTVAREVFDVSGAGDTVIASFTLAVAAGASPIEAAIFSNHAAGVVVGKVGTATVSPAELAESFRREG